MLLPRRFACCLNETTYNREKSVRHASDILRWSLELQEELRESSLRYPPMCRTGRSCRRYPKGL